jgi:hypothetical protein
MTKCKLKRWWVSVQNMRLPFARNYFEIWLFSIHKDFYQIWTAFSTISNHFQPDPNVHVWCRSWSGSGSAIFTFIYSNASLRCFSFLINGKGVMVVSICESILKFSRNKYKKNICLELIPIRIGRPRMPIRIRQNDADPTRLRSGSITLLF